MHVRDYMSPAPVTVSADADYSQSCRIMEERGLHHLPVLDGSNSVVGILARRDLQLAARYFHESPVENAEVMHAPVTTITAGANLADAAERMQSLGIGCLPVYEDGDQRLVGIITETDLLRALRDVLKGR